VPEHRPQHLRHAAPLGLDVNLVPRQPPEGRGDVDGYADRGDVVGRTLPEDPFVRSGEPYEIRSVPTGEIVDDLVVGNQYAMLIMVGINVGLTREEDPQGFDALQACLQRPSCKANLEEAFLLGEDLFPAGEALVELLRGSDQVSPSGLMGWAFRIYFPSWEE